MVVTWWLHGGYMVVTWWLRAAAPDVTGAQICEEFNAGRLSAALVTAASRLEIAAVPIQSISLQVAACDAMRRHVTAGDGRRRHAIPAAEVTACYSS